MWMSRIAAAAFAVSAILVMAQAPMAVAQQSSQDGADLITNGERLASEGKYALAVQQFTRAMRSESLTSEQVALAFYQRGKANHELGNHALAIADFTNALWIKDLPAAQQKQAEEARAQSYAALGQQNRGDTIVAQGGSSNAAPAIGAFETRVEPQAAQSSPAPARTQVASAAPSSTTDSVGAFQTSVQAAEPEAPAESQPGLFARLRNSITSSDTPAPEPETTAALPAPAQPAPQPASPEPASSWSTSTSTASAPPPPPPAAPARPEPQPSWSTSTSAASSPPAQTASAAPEPEQEGSSRIGRFFSGLRGSLRSEEPSAAPETTASTTAAPAASDWGASTTVSGSGAQPQAASDSGRSYRLQLASVRSEEDAQNTWAQIAEKHQDLVGGRQPLIEKTDLGSLGTVYRVQIGPFADKRESLQLCNSFKAGGVDCFLVAR